MSMMRRILCYGDSNTWGYEPVTARRYGPETRWTGVLQRKLGEAWVVIEEGLNGRTTVWDDPVDGEERNGLRYLIPCLKSHDPIDLVILMLGTNDLKARYGVTPPDIARSIRRLAKEVLRSEVGPLGDPPRLLLLAPPPLARLTEFSEIFGGGREKSRRLAALYREVAQEVGCEFLDVSRFVESSERDGIHWEKEEHQRLGESLAEEVLSLRL